jgi:hypothetical protein
MKQKMLLVLFIILVGPQFSSAGIRPIIILGLGGGYSLIADGGIRSNEYVFDTLINFKEKVRQKHLWNFNLQAYFMRNFGVQIEYTHQKASYFSDLKWYGWWFDGGIEGPVYVPINYFEDAYWTQWSLDAFNVGLIIGGDSPLFGELYPYATAGIGFYKMNGDPELFLNRTRLGSLTNGMEVKISGGVRHRILPFLGINLKISGKTNWRRHGRVVMEIYDSGPDQLDLELYYQTGQIYRAMNMLTKSLSYISVEINLEIILKMPSRTN